MKLLDYLSIIESLRELVASFPLLPGVYVMRDSSCKIVYIGKAKELRYRVRSYLGGGDGRAQIPALMRRVQSIETIVTANEEQAFVLERDLIRQHKPRYNIRLKDDRAFFHVRVDINAAWPRLELTRKVADDGARYFGPYSSSAELKTTLEVIKRAIPLRTCSNTVFYNRVRPCLEYQIKRCAGPCCLNVDPAQYKEWVNQAISVLLGKVDRLEQTLEQSMEKASAEMRFEDAAAIRDRISVLHHMQQAQSHASEATDNRDVVALYREESLAAVTILRVRAGRISETRNFAFTEVVVDDDEIIESTLSQYYEQPDQMIPPEIVLPFALENSSLLAQALERRTGSKVEFVVPQRGVRARLVTLATTNAKQHFTTCFDADTRYQQVAEGLAKILSLRQMPRRIECIDISNFQGSDIVGALVSFYDGAPDKPRYRKYKISLSGSPDDFASIYEVVSRRLRRGKTDGDLPDLMIIDGGAQQLAKAIQARDEVGVDLDIVALAKMRTTSNVASNEIERSHERFFVSGRVEPIELDEASEVTKFVARVRDETHRFVITFHRRTRSKRMLRSSLDTIGGLSPEKRARLLKHYGSVASMRGVAVEELARIGRMPKLLAQKVHSNVNQSADE